MTPGRPSGSDPKYTVSSTDTARQQFIELLRQRRYTGTSDLVVRAMKALHLRLENHPYDLGEPMYTLRKAGLHVRRAALDPVYIEFGVHDDPPFVVVRHVAGLGDEH